VREDFLPLDLDPVSAYLARVAYRIIQKDFARSPESYIDPCEGLGRLSRRLYQEGFSVMSLWVCSYAFHLRRGFTTSSYRHCVVRRSRIAALHREHGQPWRRVP
jgi:hypothetical protein